VKRREFITLVGGAAAAWPVGAHTQQSNKRLIGLLAVTAPVPATPQYNAILDGLRELGYTEGRDYDIIAKWAWS
jgi:putative ABC transport system substrate-binding protein